SSSARTPRETTECRRTVFMLCSQRVRTSPVVTGEGCTALNTVAAFEKSKTGRARGAAYAAIPPETGGGARNTGGSPGGSPELGRFTAPPAARGLPEGTARKRRFAIAVGAINTTEHHTRPAIPIGTREPLKPTTVAAAEMTRVFLGSLEVEGRYERQWSRAWSVGEMEESRSIRRLANTRSSRCSRIVTARYGLECCRFFESPDVGTRTNISCSAFAQRKPLDLSLTPRSKNVQPVR